MHTLNLATGEHTSMPTPVQTPAVALTSDPDILAVFLEHRIVAYDLKQGKVFSALRPPHVN